MVVSFHLAVRLFPGTQACFKMPEQFVDNKRNYADHNDADKSDIRLFPSPDVTSRSPIP